MFLQMKISERICAILKKAVFCFVSDITFLEGVVRYGRKKQ